MTLLIIDTCSSHRPRTSRTTGNLGKWNIGMVEDWKKEEKEGELEIRKGLILFCR